MISCSALGKASKYCYIVSGAQQTRHTECNIKSRERQRQELIVFIIVAALASALDDTHFSRMYRF